ncbi:hypothetical protein C5C59_05220 [Rathayibacter sp. AY1F4]|nr:hypothetical protein C5C26_11735 [Rathayibacter sp. AY2B1]PPG72881.1 hypothetical protein C5C59_05220 [Rathayibacter sp. AY1F4]
MFFIEPRAIVLDQSEQLEGFLGKIARRQGEQVGQIAIAKACPCQQASSPVSLEVRSLAIQSESPASCLIGSAEFAVSRDQREPHRRIGGGAAYLSLQKFKSSRSAARLP